MNNFDELHGHLSTAALMLHLEGELDPEADARVRAHLRDCWTCRPRLESLRRGVLTFVDYHRDVLVPLLPPIDERPALPPALTAALDHPPEPSSRWAPLLRWAAHLAPAIPVRGWVTAAVTVVFAGAIWVLTFVQPARLTASELLARVCAGRTHPRTAGSAALPRRVRIRRGRQVFEQSLQPGRRPAADAPRPDPETLAALAQANVDWQDPLNPLNFAAWHRSVSGQRDIIRETSADVTLETTLPEGSPVRFVVYTVDRAEWRPLAHHIELPGQPAIDVHELPAEPPAPVLAARPTAPPRVPAPVPAPAAEPTLPTSAELDESEVRLRELLHDLRADHDAAPLIERTPREILLTALAPSASVGEELAEAAGAIPFVIVRIRTPHAGAPSASAPAAAPPPPGPVPSGRAPLADRLRDFCGGLTEANSYLAVLAEAHSETLLAGSSLGALSERYSPQDWERLTPAHRDRLDRLTAAYRDRLRRSARAYEVLASPLLDAMLRDFDLAGRAAPPAAPVCCLSWREEAAGLSTHVHRLQSILSRLFAGSAADPAGPVDRQLLDAAAARAGLVRFLPPPP